MIFKTIKDKRTVYIINNLRVSKTYFLDIMNKIKTIPNMQHSCTYYNSVYKNKIYKIYSYPQNIFPF